MYFHSLNFIEKILFSFPGVNFFAKEHKQSEQRSGESKMQYWTVEDSPLIFLLMLG